MSAYLFSGLLFVVPLLPFVPTVLTRYLSFTMFVIPAFVALYLGFLVPTFSSVHHAYPVFFTIWYFLLSLLLH